jgi:hypothetical protein
MCAVVEEWGEGWGRCAELGCFGPLLHLFSDGADGADSGSDGGAAQLLSWQGADKPRKSGHLL